MTMSATAPLKNAWERLRGELHVASNWTTDASDTTVPRLVYVPTGAGFVGSAQLAQFVARFPPASHLFHPSQLARLDNRLQSLSLLADAETGRVSEELVLSWTQQSAKTPWLLPNHELPLKAYQLVFVMSAKFERASLATERPLLEQVHVHWDHASLLKQMDVFSDAMRPLLRSGMAESFETAYAAVPMLSGSDSVGRLLRPTPSLMNPFDAPRDETLLGSISTILTDLPVASIPAVSTPQLPARSRSINPALLSSLRFGDDLPIDSPQPAHIRSVRSRNIFVEDAGSQTANSTVRPQEQSRVFDFAPVQYAPLMAPRVIQQDSVFDDTPVPYHPILAADSKRFESRVFESGTNSGDATIVANQPQTNKNIFESHVFDGQDVAMAAASRPQVATAPPSSASASRLVTPEEDLLLGGMSHFSSTLVRPGMQGHFVGAAPGYNSTNDAPFPTPATLATKTDPNRSQFTLSGTDDDVQDRENRSHDNVLTTGSKKRFDPNRSQICLGSDDSETNVVKPLPSSRVLFPPGGISTIEL